MAVRVAKAICRIREFFFYSVLCQEPLRTQLYSIHSDCLVSVVQYIFNVYHLARVFVNSRHFTLAIRYKLKPSAV